MRKQVVTLAAEEGEIVVYINAERFSSASTASDLAGLFMMCKLRAAEVYFSSSVEFTSGAEELIGEAYVIYKRVTDNYARELAERQQSRTA